jgi:hypothetical protein
MKKRLLLVGLTLLFGIFAIAQYRTIDGTDNNLNNPDWGAAQHQLRTITSNGFADSISAPGGIDRPNPRIISNEMFAQDSLMPDVMGLSDYTWVFGQFIDHDVIETPTNPDEDASIMVDFADVHFNPGFAFPFVMIDMSRSLERPGTGTDTSNPRRYTNHITAWIDGSTVYGSEEERANYLRTFTGGKLKTSAGNLLPWNTDFNEYGAPIDPNAPAMENANPFSDQLFVAGDVRANENVSLTAVHTLFVREHNRLCDELAATHPDWDDETLYQHARKLVGGYIQSITFNEWLPTMGVQLPPYQGYNPSLNPNITNTFSAAAFRLGHTLLSSHIPRLDNDGNTIAAGDLTLLEAFFAPYELLEAGTIDPVLKGMATQIQQRLDCHVVDDVRNFLFGPPQAGLGGLDLAAININRGRERGLPDFNTLRQDIGLTAFADFADINSDPTVGETLAALYDNVNDIDPWVGMLAEEPMQDALFGETIMMIMMEQFLALRDGDRFYYQHDPGLSTSEIQDIHSTTFRDIIMRNTGITLMQANVFEAMLHDSICNANAPLATLEGNVETAGGLPVANVSVNINVYNDENPLTSNTTNQTGTYELADLPSCDHYEVVLEKNTNHSNGISTFDLILIRQHILLINELDDPYKVIAADANNDKNVSTFDLVELRKLILSIQDELSSNKSWRFVDVNTTFTDPNDPFDAVLDYLEIDAFNANSAADFIGIKIGDVNDSVDPSAFSGHVDNRSEAPFLLTIADQVIESGQNYTLAVPASKLFDLAGLQFALDFDPGALSIMNINTTAGDHLSMANFNIEKNKGLVSFSWDGEISRPDQAFFTIELEAKTDGQLSDYIHLNHDQMRAEAYSHDLLISDLELFFDPSLTTTSAETGAFTLHQNTPNPFHAQTTVSFELPGADEVILDVFDVAGRSVYTHKQAASAGLNLITIDQSQLSESGVLYYQLKTSFGNLTKKMILLD